MDGDGFGRIARGAFDVARHVSSQRDAIRAACSRFVHQSSFRDYGDTVGQFQQVMYTNATGRALVVNYFGLGYGWHAGILRGNQFTPVPWNPHTVPAAW